jgi:hypothetical protein
MGPVAINLSPLLVIRRMWIRSHALVGWLLLLKQFLFIPSQTEHFL